MADTVSVQTIENGYRNLVVKLTSVSDGTGEVLVKKVDAAAAGNGVVVQGQTFAPGVHLKIRKIVYECKGMAVRLLWDATTPTDIVVLGDMGSMDFNSFGGLPNPQAVGATGSILLSTINAALNASYTITLFMTKGVPQS
jgi:hypothetical protein